MKHLLGCVLVLILAVQGVTTVAAQSRVALVIGNSAYRHAPELKNPANDAADMSAALKSLGFNVMTGVDLDKQGMDRTIRDFAAALRGADVGVLFYAGHGLQVSGANYLVPVDAQLTNAAALDFEMVRLDLVQRAMERETATNVLFLDACRDNPLTRNLARAMGTRSAEIGRGLAPAESGVGTLVSFSTQPGNVALDGTGRNSPYAGALLKLLAMPSEDLSAVLIGVRNEVMAQTGNRQVPWEHSALRARLYLAPGQPPPQPAQPPADKAAPLQKTQDRTGAATVPAPAEKAIIASKTASLDEKRPTPLAVGETVKGRLGASKNYHYWKFDAQPGRYRVVVDVKRADGSSQQHSERDRRLCGRRSQGRRDRADQRHRISHARRSRPQDRRRPGYGAPRQQRDLDCRLLAWSFSDRCPDRLTVLRRPADDRAAYARQIRLGSARA